MKKLLFMVVAVVTAMAATAQERLYIMMKDNRAMSYPVETVDSITFSLWSPNVYTRSIEDFDALQDKMDSMQVADWKVIDSLSFEVRKLRGEVAPEITDLTGVYEYDGGYVALKKDGTVEYFRENIDTLNGRYILKDMKLHTGFKSSKGTMTKSLEGVTADYDISQTDKKYLVRRKFEYCGRGRMAINGTICKSVMSIAEFEKYKERYDCKVATEGTKLGGGYVVDLGLPSGTKWSSYNLGASKIGEYGGYYFSVNEDAFKEDDIDLLKKEGLRRLNMMYDFGIKTDMLISEKENPTDDDYFLQLKPDATIRNKSKVVYVDNAQALWGKEWITPSIPDMEELFYNCDIYVCKTSEGESMVKCVGKNGNSIVLPLAGSFDTRTDEEVDVARFGMYGTSNFGLIYYPDLRISISTTQRTES